MMKIKKTSISSTRCRRGSTQRSIIGHNRKCFVELERILLSTTMGKIASLGITRSEVSMEIGLPIRLMVIQILEQDFGLQVYFTVCDRRHGEHRDSSVSILAHLIQPSQHQALFPCSGGKICSSSMAMIIDHTLLQLPYTGLKAQFTKALLCLDLGLYITYQHTQPSQSTMSLPDEERSLTYPHRPAQGQDPINGRFLQLQKGDTRRPQVDSRKNHPV